LNGMHAPKPVEMVLQQHRDGVGLLAGGAARNPDADRLVRRPVGEQGRSDCLI
jgi:hypothetical protein